MEFKERLLNDGDITLVRKFEKRLNLSHGDEASNCTHLHIAVTRMLRKTFIAIWSHVVPKLFSTRPLSRFLCFESLGISSCMCGVSEFNVGKIQSQGEKLSQRQIHLQNFQGPRPTWWFFVAGEKPAYFGSAQNTQLIVVFFASTELQALAVIDSLVLVHNKETQTKIKLSSVNMRDLYCSRPIGVA